MMRSRFLSSALLLAVGVLFVTGSAAQQAAPAHRQKPPRRPRLPSRQEGRRRAPADRARTARHRNPQGREREAGGGQVDGLYRGRLL